MAAELTDTASLQRQLHTLNRLVEINLTLNSTLEIKLLLETIMDAAAELAGSESASILLKDKNTNELYFTASSSGAVSGLIGRPVPLEGSLAGTALQENRAVAVNDVTQDPRHYRLTDQQTHFTTRSVLGVPMRIKDEIIGVLEAVNKREGSWTGEDESTLSILASQAAIALENARLVQALQDAYEELSQVDKLKNDFIALASHELRTPLGVILGYATFLRDESEGEASEHAEAVLRSALQLRSLIEDMVNLRYLRTGKTELILEPVRVTDLVGRALNDVEEIARAKGHHLNVDLPDGAQMVHIDLQRLGMALTNLLNNAIKYTPAGGHITVRTAGRPSEVWLSVQDSGVGIPEDQLEKIFAGFRQVEDHMTRRQGGLGLGLAIARAVVEAHGGRVWAESPGPNQGSTFYLSLPLP